MEYLPENEANPEGSTTEGETLSTLIQLYLTAFLTFLVNETIILPKAE